MPNMQKLILSLCAAAVLAGCASMPAGPVAALPAYREVAELAGRLHVTFSKDGAQESLSGNFSWQQQPGKIDVDISNPLGQTVARISVTPGQATLIQSDKTPRMAPDIDVLTAQTLGWQLPVAGLKDWLQGYATDAQGQRFAAAPGKDTVTTNDGWKLRFVGWHPNGSPKRVDATRLAAAQVDELVLRIIVDE
jgi:outer membrane lipoprotein LolB